MPESKADYWRSRLTISAMTALIVVGILLVIATASQAFYSNPPISLVGLDSDYLGVLCPGEPRHLTNTVTIKRPPVVLFFHLSTMDETETYNMLNTQTDFPSRPHPHAGTFTQVLPWTVPDLPPGKYVRVLAAHGTDGDEKPLMIAAEYEIGQEEDCNE